MIGMRLSLLALLVGALFLVFAARDVEAGPIPKRKPTTFSVPLRRMEKTRNVHPQIMLQQNVNRALRRHALMTGRQVPSDLELREALNQKLDALELEADGLTKRFNRSGAKPVKRDIPVREYMESRGLRVGMAGGRSKQARHERNEGISNKETDLASIAAEIIAALGGDVSGAAGAGPAGAGAATETSKAAATATDKAAATGKGAATETGKAAATATASGAAGASASGAAADEGDVAPADSVTQSNDPATANSVALDIEGQDVGYLATVALGTPPRNFELLMDSGSADTWVGGEACQSEAGGGCGNHEFLGAQSSSSFQDSGAQFQVTYGTGAVAGTIVTDNLAVAGLNLDGHVFGVADVESVEFSDDSTSFDGLMGLAQSTLSNQKTLTPPEAMAKAGLIDAAIVSYKIPRFADGLLDGEVTFGALDETKFDAATLVNLPNVSPDGFWEADMDAATVDGTDTGLQGRTAILDTGTTLILAPEADALAIHQLIDGAATDGQGTFTVPCTTTAQLSLTFGGQEFTIDPRDLAFQPLDPADPQGDCISGISAGNIGGANEWLIGDVFLKNAYFSTNVDDNTMSLAKLV